MFQHMSLMSPGVSANGYDAVFPDGHVAFQPQPKVAATGKSMYFSTGQYPSSVVAGATWYDTAEQNRSTLTTVAEFMYALQP